MQAEAVQFQGQHQAEVLLRYTKDRPPQLHQLPQLLYPDLLTIEVQTSTEAILTADTQEVHIAEAVHLQEADSAGADPASPEAHLQEAAIAEVRPVVIDDNKTLYI